MNSERRAGDEKLLKFPKQKKTQWWDNDWFHLDAERFAFLSHLLDCTHIIQSKVHFVVHAFASTMRGFLCEYKLQLCISFYSCFFVFYPLWIRGHALDVFEYLLASNRKPTWISINAHDVCCSPSNVPLCLNVKFEWMASSQMIWTRPNGRERNNSIRKAKFAVGISRIRASRDWESESETGRQRDCKADYMVASSCR